MKGHFYKKNGTWRFIIDVGPDPKTGKRRQKHRGGFKTKKEAEAAAAQLMLEADFGYAEEENHITFEKFASDWLKIYSETNNVKLSTIAQREFCLKVLTEHLGKGKLKQITPKMYQNFLIDIKETYTYHSLTSIHTTACMIFKKALELKIIRESPTSYAKIPQKKETIVNPDVKSEHSLPKYLEKEELKAFLNAVIKYGEEQDYPIFILLAYTGMRVGELCALQWKDIHFEEKEIEINKTYYNVSKGAQEYILQTPKTSTSKRVLQIDPFVSSVLLKHLHWQKTFHLQNRNVYQDRDFVFVRTSPRYAGLPLQTQHIGRHMKHFLTLAELPAHFTPHSLRHTHTSLLAEAGVSLEEIMERLGHRSDETTKNIYLHVTKTMKKDAILKFTQLMDSV